MAESIAEKCWKLSQILDENGRTDCSWRLCREALLDAFLVLFNECGTDHMQKDKHIAGFVKKYKENVSRLHKSRPSISDFKIISIIGRGHFGQVHVVKEIHTNDVYALKTLKKSEMLSQENVAFFEEERDIMAYGKSPWITSLQCAFQDEQNLYLVMEFHPGGDLLTLLGKQENEILDEKAARFYLAEMVLALHSLHQLGYVHRDVKPDNILIDKHGHIKLADFGSAAKLSETDKKVYSKMAVGTPDYISPEVLTSMEGSGGGYGVECDWWSLGVVAYEMVFGNPPFTGTSVAITYSKIMNYKESLTFPCDTKVSTSLQSLIKGLLTDCNTRLGYDDLVKHKFFESVNWSTLGKDQPPFVPTISGVDDTSNFDEFEPEEEIKSFGTAPTPVKKVFCGKDLPFVGFTFTKTNHNNTKQETCSAGVVSEIHEAKQNGTALYSDKKKETLVLKKIVENLEYEKNLLDNEKILQETEIKELRKMLDIERTERNNADNTALRLLSEVEAMRKKARELRKEETRAAFDEQQDVLTQLEEDRFIAMNRTHRLEQELAAQQKMVEEKNVTFAELHQEIRVLKEQLKSAKSRENKVAEVFTHLRQMRAGCVQCNSAHKIRQLQAMRRQSSPMTSSTLSSQRVEEISNRILEAIVKCREEEKGDLKRMRERLKQKMDECSKLETQLDNCKPLKRQLQKAEHKLAEVEKENKLFSEAIKKMEKEVEETYDESQVVKRDAQAQEKKFKESEAVVSKLREDLQLAKQERESTKNTNKGLQEELVEWKERHMNLQNTHETLNEELKAKTKHIEKLEWTAKYTSPTQASQEENKLDCKSQLEMRNRELKEAESKNKELKEEIFAVVTKVEELEQELREKERLIENLLKNELTIKASLENTDTAENDSNSKDLRTEIISLNNKNREIEYENKELNDQVEKLMGKCESLLKTKEELESELCEKLRVIAGLESTKTPSKKVLLKESIRRDSEEVQDLKAEIVVMNNENKELKAKNKDLQSNVRQLTGDVSELRKESETFNDELSTKVTKLEDQEKTITMLKSTCTMLEGQIEELEILNDELDEKNLQLEIEKKQLLLSNEKYEARLEEELATEKEGVVNGDELDKHKTLIKEYTETIASQDNQLKISELNLKSLERKMEKEMATKDKLLNEIEQLKSSAASLEEANSQLNEELQGIKEREEELLSENSSMAEHLETLKSLHAEEKVKLVSTSAQQSKLIDFLQSKAENKSSKRKRLGVSNLISSRKHQESNFIPCQWSELQQALEKERASRVLLQNELNKVKEELEDSKEKVMQWKARCTMTPSATVPRSNQSLAVLSALQQSPSRQPSPGTTLTPTSSRKRTGSNAGTGTHRPKERMHHNIPHRFTVVLNMRATRCPVCLGSILFGRQVSRCTECNVVCHCKCSLSLQHTCGLPTQYVEHFSEALMGSKTETSLLSTPGEDVSDGGAVYHEGWLKVPRNGSAKNGWDSKWVVLKDGSLSVFETTEDDYEIVDPSDTMVLFGIDEAEVKVHSAVAGSDLVGAAATDLPYVFCLEARPRTTCWPGRTLFLLAPSFPEKQKWVRALEKVVSDKKEAASSPIAQKINGNLLLRMKGEGCLDINTTAVLNDKFVLLGAEEGLFILSVAKPGKDNTPRQIPGVRNVFQIKVERDLGMALVISGAERELLCVDIKQIEACTKQSREVPLSQLDFQSVENITNCHLFASKKVDEGFFLCAALPNKISILRFNSSMNSFVIRKEIDSSEPCSCILFSKSHIIVGSNKFYQIDLRQFTIKDFLDCQEPSLAFVVYHASQASSFPIDVLQVSPSSSSEEEFLLCFNGFGVFVNSNGKRTRHDDLKWAGLPLSFAYQEPYLFVTHFNSIEICQLPAPKAEEKRPLCCKSVEVTRPRILGAAMTPGAIYLVSTGTDEIEMLCYQANVTPALSAIDQNNTSPERNTFTSRHGRKRLHTATGCENAPPDSLKSSNSNSLSAFSRNPKRFLRNSLRY